MGYLQGGETELENGGLPRVLCAGGDGRNVKRFRGGLVFKAHRLLYYSTLGSRVIKKGRRSGDAYAVRESVLPGEEVLVCGDRRARGRHRSLTLTLSHTLSPHSSNHALSLSHTNTHTLSLSLTLTQGCIRCPGSRACRGGRLPRRRRSARQGSAPPQTRPPLGRVEGKS